MTITIEQDGTKVTVETQNDLDQIISALRGALVVLTYSESTLKNYLVRSDEVDEFVNTFYK